MEGDGRADRLSAGAGIMVILLCWFGTISLMLALIPSVAILPILFISGC